MFIFEFEFSKLVNLKALAENTVYSYMQVLKVNT